MKKCWRLFTLALILAGCAGGPDPAPVVKTPSAPKVTVPDQTAVPVITIPGQSLRPAEDQLTITAQLEIFTRTGDPSQARQAIETQVGLPKLTLADREAYAGLLMAEGLTQKAETEYLGILEKKPGDRDTLIALGYIASARGDIPGQKARLDEALGAHPEDPGVLAALGFFHLAQNSTDQAGVFFNRSVAFADNAEAREGLTRVAIAKEKWQDAVDQASAGITLDPARDSLYSLRAQAYIAQEKYLPAEKELDQAVRLAPAYTWHYLDRGRLRWRELYKPEAALEDINKVLSQDPQNFFALVYRGEIYESKDQADLAYKDFSAAISQRPDYRYAWPSLAILAFQAKDWAKAAEFAQKSWTLHQGEYAFPWIAALSYRYMGQEPQAKALLEKAFRSYGNQPLIQEMCRFLLTPAVSFALDNSLSKERNPLVKYRLMFYQGIQYDVMKRPQSARALWEAVSSQTLRNVPEVRMAKALMAESN